MNKISRSILTLQVAKIGIDIISASFKFSNDCEFFNFLKAYVTSRVLSIMPKIPEISVGIQMERSGSVSSDRNIRDHL